MIEPKRMGQLPRRNIAVIKPGNKGELRNCKTPIQAWSLLFADSTVQKLLLHMNEENAIRRATCKQKLHTVA